MKEKKEMIGLAAKADTLWSKAVKLYNGNRCVVCGQVYHIGNLHSHHIIKRRVEFLRWDVRNGAVVCYLCHMNDVHGEGYDKFLEESSEHYAFLYQAKNVRLKDMLDNLKMTRKEFIQERIVILKKIIEDRNHE